MAQSLARVWIHLVFSTKNREPFLTPTIRAKLFPYLVGLFRQLDCPVRQVGGVEDHVHVLFALSRTQTIAKVVESVKTSSSKWLKSKGHELGSFYWQAGYGAFSVSESSVSSVVRYIQRQEEHHRRVGFKDELRSMLRLHRIEFDESFVWE